MHACRPNKPNLTKKYILSIATSCPFKGQFYDVRNLDLDPSKPSTEGYAMDCIGCGPGGSHWPPDCPLNHTEAYDRTIAEVFSVLIDSSHMDEPYSSLES
ncbi:hypothetical protein M0R45_014023 [Rubus argutus]|uniref:Uncharacterized protein n=1 Tax=Rubus argutus TaxID=59490 RepID=A0AAW1XL21_RUBAR